MDSCLILEDVEIPECHRFHPTAQVPVKLAMVSNYLLGTYLFGFREYARIVWYTSTIHAQYPRVWRYRPSI